MGRGDRIATLMGNRFEHVALLMASGRIGAALVPLNWRLAAAELRPILQDARPRCLITDTSYRALAHRVLPDPAITLLDLDDEAWMHPREARGGRLSRVEPDAPAMVLYTSGSTGRPKGALLPHRQLYANAVATCRAWKLSADDVAPITTPLFHTGGWNVFATPVWHAGGSVVLLDGFDPDDFLTALAEEGCTVALAVPTQLHLLLQSPGWGAPHPGFRYLVSGGAPCPPSVAGAVRAAGWSFREGYGLTECGPNCFTQTVEESAAEPGWVGRPIDFLEMELRLEDGARVVGAGRGELVLRGPQVFAGYLGSPEKNREAFTRDGWLRTGDVAERTPNGRYRICGRLKEMFISGGENVYPGEVEAVLLEHPSVSEAAVVGVPDEKWGEVGRAWIVLVPDTVLEATELRDFARERLAGYKVPKSVRFVDELPRLGSGKIDRAALVERVGRPVPGGS
ncbi:MAG: AMP-binding protein [Gemmatimonadota bacterium]